MLGHRVGRLGLRDIAPEHWNYPPRKMKLPHSTLTVKQLRKQMEYALEHERYSVVRNIAGDGHLT